VIVDRVGPQVRALIRHIIECLNLIQLQTTVLDDTELLAEIYDPEYHRYITIRIRTVRANGSTCTDHRIQFQPRPTACRLPLGAVQAGCFDYTAFRRMINAAPPADVHDDLRRMLKWFTSPLLAELLHRARHAQPDQVPPPCFDECLRHLQPHHLDNRGIHVARIIDRADAHFGAVAFLVPKSDLEHSRFVWNGHEFDKWFKLAHGPPPPMPPLHPRLVITRILSGWRHISMIDFSSWFFQFRLPPELQPFFAFNVHDTTMVMTVLPMGVCFAPAWAQHVALFITQEVHRRLRDLHFDIVVWIDNLLVLSHDARDDARIRATLDRVLVELSVRAKAWETGSHGGTRITALGLNIDLRTRTIRPSAKSETKIDRALRDFATSRTPATFFAVTGNIMWFAFVTSTPLCFFGEFMQFIREQSRRAIYHAPEWLARDDITFNDLILDQIRHVYAAVRHAHVVGDQRRPPPSAAKWATDASPHAIAGVNRANHDTFIVPLMTSHRGILPAELLGGLLAALLFRDRNAAAEPSTWITDNIAAKFALLKAHSGNELTDIILCVWLLFAELPDHVVWVPSECQPADPLTRLCSMPPSVPHLHALRLQHEQNCERCADPQHHRAMEIPRWRLRPDSNPLSVQ
jgi:hypothetical protein